jgi:PKD repeat protein
LLGDGAAHYTPSDGSPIRVVPDGIGIGMGIVMGDFGGDGIPDVAYKRDLTSLGQDLFVLHGNGIGGFEPARSYSTAHPGDNRLTVCDIDGNGCDDIVTACADGSLNHNRFNFLVTNGTGSFSETEGPLCGYVSSMAGGDANGDGIGDLIVHGIRDGYNSRGLFVWLGDGVGGFSLAQGSPFLLDDEWTGYESIGAADADGNGKPDIVISSYNEPFWGAARAHKVSVLLNMTPVPFKPFLLPPFLAGGTVFKPFSHAIGASGTEPVTFSASALPPGLALNGNTISGVPTASGQTDVTLTATNSAGSDTRTLVITVTCGGIELTTPNLNLQLGDAFTVSVNLRDAIPFADWQQFLRFDNTKLELVGQQAGDFSTFTPDGRSLAEINGSGEVRAGGQSGDNNTGGDGALGRFTFKAIGWGDVSIGTEKHSADNRHGNLLVPTGTEGVEPAHISPLAVNVNATPVIVSGPLAQPNPADVNQSVSFTASAYDPEGKSLSFAWDFGDGSSGSGPSATHAYTAEGTYTVTVTVDDGLGGTATGTVTVVVGNASIVYGDCNGDGAFNAADINHFIDWILGKLVIPSLPLPGEPAFEAADVDGDGSLTPADINLMIDKLLGKIDAFPVEQ